MSSLTGKEIQIVTALSTADLPEALIGNSCVKELVGAVVGAQQQTKVANDKLQAARSEKDSQNAVSRWWNNTEDKIKDAQLDLTTTISNLNRHSSQLLIFNTAISKVLCDQQDILLRQQKILEEQAAQLKHQNLEILDQQNALEIQQGEIKKANQGLMEAKGVTAEQARNLVGCVQRVEAAEERISEVNRQLLVAIEEHLNQVRNDLGASQALAVAALESRGDELVRLIEGHEHQLASHSALQQELQGRLARFEEALPQQIESSINQLVAPVLHRVGVLEQRNGELALQQTKLAKWVVASSSLAGVALAGLALAMLLLRQNGVF
ncbi:hypothetical protein [Stutzerimonas stutzeri]|uniref:hypothetical protein n=1 Tax=Stutzerimonas stutzeri TaxID=316 RepID=UPI000F7A73DA|nr:hypothetical protein [Stutzerimonas stutzeri]MCP3432558.1 hypothetical protein [Stutzerimonas stutzeri]RTM24802.1 hypothetical protein EKN22_05235 [Stutzerimonas stutzeri]